MNYNDFRNMTTEGQLTFLSGIYEKYSKNGGIQNYLIGFIDDGLVKEITISFNEFWTGVKFQGGSKSSLGKNSIDSRVLKYRFSKKAFSDKVARAHVLCTQEEMETLKKRLGNYGIAFEYLHGKHGHDNKKFYESPDFYYNGLPVQAKFSGRSAANVTSVNLLLRLENMI